MAGHDNQADVFAIPDFWQKSKWLEQLVPEAPAPPLLLDPTASDKPRSSLIFSLPVTLDQDGFFKLPPLDAAETREPDTEPGPDGASTVSDSSGGSEVASNVWMELQDLPQKNTGLRTWDVFDTGEVATHQPMFISEAGPSVYDALLSWSADPLGLENSQVPVVEARTYFSSLLSLSLGRESVFFTRDDELASFKPTLPSIRISGYSRQVLQGVEKQALCCGAAFLQLSAFVRSAYATNSSRCGVALASSINQVVQAVEQRLAADCQRPRSLLELQSSIKDMSAILTPFRDLVSQLHRRCSDSDILSLVFHTASSLDDGEEYIRDILREMLRRVSAPWIELLEEWIGTRREEGVPLTKFAEGESRGIVKVEVEAYVDDFGRELEDVDFRLDHSKVPDFMPSEMTESIFETGRNLRFIRTFHPEHLLARQAVVESMHPPSATWLYDWDSILDLESRVSRYRDSLRDALQGSRRSSLPKPPGVELEARQSSSAFGPDVLGLDQNGLEKRLLALMDQFDQPIVGPNGEDSLGRIVRERLSDRCHAATDQADATPHWSLLPVLSFGGLVAAQAQVINQESLRLLFDAHGLRGHLKLQRDFHLLGNGIFCSRLSHALFDPDLESAERAAGVARQGGVMGLRLGGRDTWPPASSELRLALMGVLAESHGAQASHFGDSLGLPGDLSFAVRDLSPEEIDRCMHADSLEALDFLRLSYKAPPQLAAVITPIHLMHYDCIFRLLLRVLRMLHVVNQLHRDINTRAGAWHSPGHASYRLAREAQVFVSSVASYFLDTGVAIPWQGFERRLDQVQAELGQVAHEGLQSPDGLRELHSRVLDRIMFSLFLKKRQQPALKLLEDLFSTVLRHAKHSRLQALGRAGETGGEQEAAELYADFKRKMQVFITLCRRLSEKGRAGGGKASEELGVGEDSLVAQLLMKLDMDNYYCRH